MNVYVAGSTREKQRVRRVMEHLRELGHEVSFDWTFPQDQWRHDPDGYGRWLAEQERYGVDDADALVLLWNDRPENTDPGQEPKGTLRGALIEAGMAMAQRKPVHVVGGPGSLFFCLPEARSFEGDREAVEAF